MDIGQKFSIVKVFWVFIVFKRFLSFGSNVFFVWVKLLECMQTLDGDARSCDGIKCLSNKSKSNSLKVRMFFLNAFLSKIPDIPNR